MVVIILNSILSPYFRSSIIMNLSDRDPPGQRSSLVCGTKLSFIISNNHSFDCLIIYTDTIHKFTSS